MAKRKRPPKKKFHARVEIYFVIYLATIISFFTVEGEVREYKKKQNNLILEISREKIEQLVKIDRIDPFHEKDTLTLNVKLEGFFDKPTLKGRVIFTPLSEEVQPKLLKDQSLEFPLKPVNADPRDTWFAAKIPKKKFGKNANLPHEVTAEISVKPEFNEKVREHWMEAYKDEYLVSKLINTINQVGRINLEKTFPNRIVPVGAGVVSPFTMQVPRKSFNILQGLSREIPIFIGGVKEKADFKISVVQGKDLIVDQFINTPESRLTVKGTQSGHVRIVGSRLSDNEKDQVDFDINVRPPVWVQTPSINEVYLGENYTFDGSLRDISSDQIEIKVSGSAAEKPGVVAGAQVSVGPFEKEGEILFQVLVDGNAIPNMSHSVKVLKPPPPSVKLVDRDPKTSNNLIFEIITYGRTNGVLRFQQRGGIVRNQQVSEPEIRGSKKYYRWLVEIEKPYNEEAFQEISFKVWDKFKQATEHRKQYQFYY